MTTSSSPAATPLRPLHDYLDHPPAVLCPDRSTFAQALASATRNASVARRHETSDVGLSSTDRRYELAYPLYLSAATDFLWCCRNLAHAGVEVQDGGQERAASLREKLMGQARKAMQRAEKIREVKGAQWAKRWGGGGDQGGRHAQVENQARVLRDSASVNALRFEPWLPAGPGKGAEPQPLPRLSRAQEGAGARFRRPEQAMLLSDGAPLRGHSITQDAVTNCGLVAALEVVAEHDYRWGAALLRKPLLSGVSPTASASYPIRLHYNGCLRTIVVDDQLPHWSTGDLMCAAVSSPRAEQSSSTTILPALVEKAYLTILRTYAPPGSVPAEDLHVLTGWLPEVVDLPATAAIAASTTSFQREKTWQRLWRAWQQGSVLICAGTRVGAQQGASSSSSSSSGADLIPGHSYALLEMSGGDAEGHDRTVTLMNPWRPSSKTTAAAAVASSTEGPATPSSAAATQEPMCLSWDIFCTRFATLHLAWDPTKLFSHVAEIHARWAAPSSPGAGDSDGTSGQSGPKKRITVVRNVELSLTVTQTSTGGRRVAISDSDDEAHEAQEGIGEVWLHLSRHIRRTTPSACRSYIAIHIFEGTDSNASGAGRVIPVGGNRAGRGDYVSSSHHVVRFQPSFLASEILRSEEPGVSQMGKPLSKRYSVVIALHQEGGEHGDEANDAREDDGAGHDDDGDTEERFTLRCWSSSSHSISLGDAHDSDSDSSPAWSDTISDSWLSSFSAGGHRLCPTYHTNPQYLLVVPAGTPQGVEVRLTLQTSPPVPCHLCLAYLPDTASEGSTSTSASSSTPIVRRIDNIDSPASLVAQSGAYAVGLTRLRARLPGTGAARPGLYVLVVSSFEPGTEASFDVQIECPQMRVVVGKRAWNGGGAGAGSETGGPALGVYPIPSEGAGMYAKVARGRWSVAEGTAAGPPNRGRYYENPAWVIEVPSGGAERGGGAGASRYVKAIFRLQAEGSATAEAHRDANGGDEDLASSLGGLSLAQHDNSTTPAPLPRYPATNLSLFSLPSSSADDDTSRLTLDATSGPYHSSATGSALHSVQLARGQRYRLVASQWLNGGEGEGAFELKGWCDERGWGWSRVR